MLGLVPHKLCLLVAHQLAGAACRAVTDLAVPHSLCWLHTSWLVLHAGQSLFKQYPTACACQHTNIRVPLEGIHYVHHAICQPP